MPEELLDGFLHGLAEDGGGDGSGDEVERQAGGGVRKPRLPEAAEEIDEKVDDIPPEINEEGDEGSQVEGDVEGKAGLGPAQEPGDQDQVGGTADGQDFGEPLDDPEQRRMSDGHGDLLVERG